MPFLLCLIVFTFWLVVGLAAINLLLPRRRSLRDLLLAPAVGASITLLATFTLNRWGWPVGRFGPWLTICLLAGAALIVWRRWPGLPVRRYAPFAVLLVLALLLAGRPMRGYGFDWLSYCNNDMANYCLAAARVLRHGFFDPPTASDLIDCQDLAQWHWALHVVGGIRCGSEMFIAWVSSCTGLTVHAVFMPVTLTLHLMLVSAAAALAASCRRPRRAMLWACALGAVSPLLTYGALAQLIAQVAGMGVACALTTVLLLRQRWCPRARYLGRSVLLGTLGAALLVLYPEIVPLLALAFVVYLALLLRRGKAAPLPLLGSAAIALLISVVLLREYFPASVRFLLTQAKYGTGSNDELRAIFPYYLVPAGLANLWGLAPLGVPVPEPRLSLVILAGAGLIVVVLGCAGVLALRRVPVAVPCVVGAVMAAGLGAIKSGFGLFKLAMFMQPFLLGTLAIACACNRSRVRQAVVAALLLAFVTFDLQTQRHYVRTSYGEGNSGQVRNASYHRYLRAFKDRVDHCPGRSFLVDSSNYSLVRLVADYLRGRSACFPFQPWFQEGYERSSGPGGLASLCRDPEALEVLRQFQAYFEQCSVRADFDLHDSANPGATNGFIVNRHGCPDRGMSQCEYLITGDRQTVFNARGMPDFDAPPFQVVPMDRVHNHLLFITSDRGKPLHTPAAYYHLEPNPAHGGYIQSVGRHLLFEVLNPTPGMRLVLDLTASLNADGENHVPGAAVIGERRIPMGAVGRGSCRLFSPPLVPQCIHGHYYVALDMESEGGGFDYRQKNLAGMWGSDYKLDRRRFVGFARDISAVSAQEYDRLRAPTILTSFPDDLRNVDLEYSGLYEEGWSAEEAFCVLAHPGGQAVLVIEGDLQQSSSANRDREMVVRVDGKEVLRKLVAPGSFASHCPVVGPPGRRRIELHFSGSEAPAPDTRRVSARLRRLGFERTADEPVSTEDRSAAHR